MGVIDVRWAPDEHDPTPQCERISSKDGWKSSGFGGPAFADADFEMYIETSDISGIIVRVTFNKEILKLLELNIESYIQKHYGYDHTPIDPEMEKHPLIFMMEMGPETPIKYKIPNSESEYVVKQASTIKPGTTLYGKADISIEKVCLEWKETDDGVVDNTRHFHYDDVEIMSYRADIFE
jgi:hypothetical protein